MNLPFPLLTIIIFCSIFPVAIHNHNTGTGTCSMSIEDIGHGIAVFAPSTPVPVSRDAMLSIPNAPNVGTDCLCLGQKSPIGLTPVPVPPLPLFPRWHRRVKMCSFPSTASFVFLRHRWARSRLRSLVFLKRRGLRGRRGTRRTRRWSSVVAMVTLQLELDVCIYALHQEIRMKFWGYFCQRHKRPPKQVKERLPGIKRKKWKSMSTAFSGNYLLRDIFYGRCNRRPMSVALDMVLCWAFKYIVALTAYKYRLFQFWMQYVIVIARHHLICRWQNICLRFRVVNMQCRLFVLVARCSSLSHAIRVTRGLRFRVESGGHTRKTALSWKTIAFIYAYAYLIDLSHLLCDIEPAMCGDASTLHFFVRAMATKIMMSGFGDIVIITAIGFYLYLQLPRTVGEALARLQKIGTTYGGGGGAPVPQVQERVVHKARRRCCQGLNPHCRLFFILLILNLPTLVIAPSTNASSSAASILPIAMAAVGGAAATRAAHLAHRTRKWTERENRLRDRCVMCGIEYVAPHQYEDERQQDARRRKMEDACGVLETERATKRQCLAVDEALRDSCKELGVRYQAPPPGESEEEMKKRVGQIRQATTAAKAAAKAVKPAAKAVRTAERRSAAEEALRHRCKELGVRYQAPSPGESEEEMKKRRKRVREACLKKAERRSAAEEALRDSCKELGVRYQAPPPGESEGEMKKRVGQIREALNAAAKAVKAAERRSAAEEALRDSCTELGVRYQAPPPGESKGEMKKRRKRVREACLKKAEEDAFREDDILHDDDVPYIQVSLDGMEKARELLLRTRTGAEGDGDNHRHTHRAVGCTVCDEFIIGTEEECLISKGVLLENKDRLSVDMYQECYCGGAPMDEVLIKQYEVKGCEGLLLSRRFGKDDATEFMVCSKCMNSLKRQKKSGVSPKYSIANGNAIGTIPSTIVFDGGDGQMKSLRTIKDALDENGSPIPNQSESLVTSVMAAAIAPIRPYAYIFSYRGGQHHSLIGNFQFFELNQTKVAGALDCLHQSGNSSNIYVVLNGRMTPTQKDIVRKKAELDISLYFGLLRWFKAHHPAYKDVPIGDATSPLKVELIEDPSTDANTDLASDDDPKENREDGATFYFSGGGEPTTDTSVYRSSKELVMALLKDHSAPTLAIHGGDYASHFDVKKLENVFPAVFPFGSGGPTLDRQNPISDEELIRHYLRLSLPQFMESEFVLVANYLLGQILSFKSAVMKCRPLVDEHGTAVGDEIGRMTVEEIEELLSGEDEEDHGSDDGANTTAKKFLKAVSASCRHLGTSAEAAKVARRKCFALQDFFGMHSLFITITIDDECSFRVRLFPYADANTEGTPLPPLDSSDADCLADLTLRRRIRKKYPGACALEFQSAMQIALECLFGWDPSRQKGKRGLFGIMEAFCRGDEEQGRGSLHAHWLVWIKNFGHLRRLMFSEDDHKRELARANYIAYVNSVMCARQCAFEVEATCRCKRKGATDDIFDNRSAVIFREARHEQGCRLKDDDEGGPGRVMQCRGCGHITSPKEITASVLKNLQQEALENLQQEDPGDLHLPASGDLFPDDRLDSYIAGNSEDPDSISRAILDIAAYRTVYDVPDGNDKDPDSKLRSILLNERFNQHSTVHASSCFKKGCECRFLFPFLASSGSKLDIAVADLMSEIIRRWQLKVRSHRGEGGPGEMEDQLLDEESADAVKSWLERLSDACSGVADDGCTFDREAVAVAEVFALIKREASETGMNTALMDELVRSAGAFEAMTKAIAENKGTEIYEGKTPVEVTRHTLDGSTSREKRFVVDIHRPQGCQFMNVYNRVLSHLFTCNTNVAAGDSGQTWYQTLYNCKNTQTDDREPRDVVARSVIRRLIRAQREKEERELAGSASAEEVGEVNTWVEGLSRVLSGINAATSRNVISAPMSHNLASNGGSRFHFSHQFAELLIGQLSDVLDPDRKHKVSAILRKCKKEGEDATSWRDISANDYIYRPGVLDGICFYHHSMYYTKLYKKEGLSETGEDDVEAERLTFRDGHPGSKFAYLSKLRRVRIPNVSIPDGKLCRIKELCIGNNGDCLSREAEKRREDYAEMALLMFCPIKGYGEGDDRRGEDGKESFRLDGSFWKKFDAFRTKYFEQGGYHSQSYKTKCEKEFLLSSSDFDPDSDEIREQYLDLNGDESDPHDTFWIKGFEILQNIEDRMCMEQCQGRATDVVSDIAPYPEKYKDDSGAKKADEENGRDDLAKDIAFYCQQYDECDQLQEDGGHYVRPYTQKRLLSDDLGGGRIMEARITSTTDITAVSENGDGIPIPATATVSDNAMQTTRDRKSYDTIIQLIQGSLLGGGNYDDVYSANEMDVEMDVEMDAVPDTEGCAGDKPQTAAVPTLEDIARTVLREENKRLDEKQYIMYEVIACSFLLRLLKQEEDSILVQRRVGGAIGQGDTDDIERLKRALRDRGGREQLLMFVTGFAGAGKSTAIKVAQKFCYEFCKATSVMWADNTFLFTAYTGSAAAAFGGLTTVKATYIGKNGDTPKLSIEEERAFEGVRILIIDEVSFLTDRELLKLDRTLQRIGDRSKPFGGYSIIFSGDFQQNEPVRMKPSEKLWHPTSSGHFESSINCAIILDGIHRFRDDEAYGRILQRLCRGEMTQNDVDLVNSRYVGAGGIQLPKKLDGDTCYACHTNKQRNAITAGIFQEHLKRTHPLADDANEPPKHTIIIKGLVQSVTSSGANVGALRQRIIELGDADLKQGTKLISPHLCCYVGAYFMCNSNDNLKEHGTGNGTQARLVEVRLKANPASFGCEVWDGRKVWTVCASDVEYVKFEHYPRKGESSRFFKLVPKKVTAVAEVLPHDEASETVQMRCSITQIPVNASDAITGHKLQGLTKDNVIVCSWNKTTNWIYVVLSRVRTLKGLYLFRRLRLGDIKPPSRDYLAFLRRMQVLQQGDLRRMRSRRAT